MVYAMENGHEFWNMECWEICRFRSLKTGAGELAKYKLCFGRVEEVRYNKLDTEPVGSLGGQRRSKFLEVSVVQPKDHLA
jgi:hypothetical protein